MYQRILSKICVVDEEHAKYFFTNVIILGEKNNGFINIKSNKNNDMIIQISANNIPNERNFYGIKNDGRNLFNNEAKEYYSFLKYNILGEETVYQQFEGESSFIQLSSDDDSINGEEYFLNIGIGDQYTELFDFEQKDYKIIKTEEFLEKEIYSYKNTIMKLSQESDNDKNYYLVVIINKYDTNQYKISMNKLYFSSKIIEGGYYIEASEPISCTENKMISCFQTNQKKIICLYRGIDDDDDLEYFYVSIYECCFSEIKTEKLGRSESANVFYKGIHLKQEIGFFCYFPNESNGRPILSFKIFDSVTSEMNDYNSFGNITLSQGPYDYNIMLNDILKISDTIVCYVASTIYRTDLYIIIFRLYKDDEKMNIRMYLQVFLQVNSLMIYNGLLSLSLYNNQYLALGVDICFTSNCNSGDDHYASLIIFSYPNSTDVDIDLVQLLYQTNERINTIGFNLEDYTFIDNNLFKYTFQGIKILTIPADIKLISTVNNAEIDAGYMLAKNEKITLSFTSNDFYSIKNYTFKYALILTESGFYDFQGNIFVHDMTYGGLDEIEYPNGGTYIGRTSYFNIMIKKELTTECSDSHCLLCLSTDDNYCITCENVYTFVENTKICDIIPITTQSTLPKDVSTTNPSPPETTFPLNKRTTIITSTPTTNRSPPETTFPLNKKTTIITSTPTTNPSPPETTFPLNKRTTIITSIPTTNPSPPDTTFPLNKKTTIIISTHIQTSSSSLYYPFSTIVSTNLKKPYSTIITTNIVYPSNSINSKSTEFSLSTIHSSSPNHDIQTTNPVHTSNPIYSSSYINSEESMTDKYSSNSIYSKPSTSSFFPTYSSSISSTNNNKNIISSTHFSSKSPDYSYSTLLKIPKSYKVNENNEIVCSDEQILENACKEGKMTYEQIDNIHDTLQGNINNNQNTLIETKNAVFQVSTVDEQKNNEKPNISSIDLGECERIIKEKTPGLSKDDELIIFKTDIKIEDKQTDHMTTYVQYEVYNPYTFDKINLAICEKSDISISVPVYLNQNIELLNEKLNSSGYNIFNHNDSFYNDICSKYTTDNGTDISINDRRNYVYTRVGNMSLCQEGCNFLYYDGNTKKAKCNCAIQDDGSFMSDIENIKNMFKSDKCLVEIFTEALSFSNFLTLKCYNLLFNFRDLVHNIGFLIITVLVIIYIILILKFVINDRKQIQTLLKSIMYYKKVIENENNEKKTLKNKNIKNKNKMNRKNMTTKKTKTNSNNIKINQKDSINKKSTIDKEKSKSKNKKERINTTINKSKTKNNKSQKAYKSNRTKGAPPSKKNNSKSKIIKGRNNNSNNKPIKKIINAKILFLKDVVINKHASGSNEGFSSGSRHKFNNSARKNIFTKKLNKSSKFVNKMTINNKANKIKQNQNKSQNKKLNPNFSLTIQELNVLEYKEAIKIDKRTYCQYYTSLLLKKHLLLFSFIPIKDYNITSLKISLLVISFTLYFAINALFFNDNSMHNIYIDKGSFNPIYQFPIIIYSSVISIIIQQILRLLALPENRLIEIKTEFSLDIIKRQSETIQKYMKIKFIIFFTFGFCLMLFFWYFISCFCAVFNNTQIILIKDTFLTFGVSMIYPLIYNLLPGCFRIIALRSKKQDKKCIYSFSLLLAVL